MSLNTAIALTSLANVKTFMGKESQKDGIWIYSDGASATAATVEVTDTTLILIIT
ncbi:hypothetical protein LCGC14_1461010, partial [marine sediment metagenome]